MKNYGGSRNPRRNKNGGRRKQRPPVAEIIEEGQEENVGSGGGFIGAPEMGGYHDGAAILAKRAAVSRGFLGERRVERELDTC